MLNPNRLEEKNNPQPDPEEERLRALLAAAYSTIFVHTGTIQ